MSENKFLPQGFTLPDGSRRGKILACDSLWQIVRTSEGSSALIVLPVLYEKWLADNLIGEKLFSPVNFNNELYFVLTCRSGYLISSVQYGPYPESLIEARTFAMSLREMRKSAGKNLSFSDAIYLEQFSLLLPAYTNNNINDDEIILGSWLTSGVRVNAVESFNDLCKLLTWLPVSEIKSIVQEAGFVVHDEVPDSNLPQNLPQTLTKSRHDKNFSLPGRPMLESFFNEHVIDIISNQDKYSRMGIYFPSAIVLYGPPGCGKTFAVEKLANFLEWPCYKIDSGSIGSPYIHDTSKKTAEIFNEASRNAPSIVIIDEMDAFLSDRNMNNSGTHHAEEVSEFLRCVPEAAKNHVLVIAMTNRLDAIDSAMLRHGRFDNIIEVNMPDSEEVKDLLCSLLRDLPSANNDNIDLSGLAKRLSGRPLSDAAFVVREAARLSVRAGKEFIDSQSLEAAYNLLEPKKDSGRKIGF